MTDHPLARPMTRLINLLQRSPSPDWQALQPALLEAAAYTRTLQARTRIDLPLLAAVPGFEDMRTRCETALSEQGGVLAGLAEAVQNRDPELLDALIDPVVRVAARLSENLERLRQMARRMPHFSDLPILDEMMTLALNQLKAQGDFSADLRERLPALRGFLQYLHQVAGRFRNRHPQRTDLADGLEEVVGSLEQAAGGVFLYLSDSRDLVDLSLALTLMDRGLIRLGRLFQEMREVEHASLVFSENPALDRLARSVQALQAGEPGLAQMEEDLRDLTRFHQSLAREAAILESATFMPLSLRDQTLPPIFELLGQMDIELNLLHQRPADPQAMAEALNRYQALASALDQTQAGLEEHLASLPRLSEAGHFEEFSALLHGVYTGSVPDARLEEKVRTLQGLQQQFRSQLATSKFPDSQHALEALDEQARALELAEEYLRTGRRDCLLGSFEALLSPTRRLIELKNQSEALSQEPGHRDGIASHDRGGLNPPEFAGHLDLYDSGAQAFQDERPSGLSKNFQHLVEILQDVTAGRLSSLQAREQVAEFLQTIDRAEGQMRNQVAPLVLGAADETLSSYQEELEALVAYLREIVESILEALEHENLAVLPEMEARAREIGEALARYHEEVTRAAS